MYIDNSFGSILLSSALRFEPLTYAQRTQLADKIISTPEGETKASGEKSYERLLAESISELNTEAIYGIKFADEILGIVTFNERDAAVHLTNIYILPDYRNYKIAPAVMSKLALEHDKNLTLTCLDERRFKYINRMKPDSVSDPNFFNQRMVLGLTPNNVLLVY